MSNNKSWIWWLVGAVIVLGAFFAWPKINNPDKEIISKWKEMDVECLTNGHTNSAQHIHPHLEIVIDGQNSYVPENIGILKSCMAELHTHDNSGKIHIETNYAGKKFALQKFFDLWGESIEKKGYNLEMTVGGLPSQEFGNLILEDNQIIVLKYTKQ